MTPEEARARVSSLFEEWYAVLVRYARQRTGSLAAAEDAVQDTMMSLYQRLLEQRTVDNPSAWVFCVLRRELIRAYRMESRDARVLQDMQELSGAAGENIQAPLTEESKDWRRQDLDRYLCVLTEREREALLLRAQALKYREIADELGITINSVKTLLARALRKVRQAGQFEPATGGATRREIDVHKTTLH